MTNQQTEETTKKITSKKQVSASGGNKQTGLSLKSSSAPNNKPKTSEIIDPVAISKRLEKSTATIGKEVEKINGVIKSFCKIGYELYKVREEKLYLGKDYKNVSEYAEAAFQFQKSSTANYISICERFSVKKDGKPTAQLLPEYEKYNYGQLSLMLSLPAEKLPEITPDKPCSEIREIKRQAKIKKELKGSVSSSVSGSSSSSSGCVSGSGAVSGSLNSDNLVRYVVVWYRENAENQIVPFKDATLTIAADKTDKIYKEICVLLNNDWYDFGRDGDSFTVSLIKQSGGDSNE